MTEDNSDTLENFLIGRGISKTIIDKNKQDIAKSDSSYYAFYDLASKEEAEDVMIPVEQIKGISRVSGYTWFEIFTYLSNGIPEGLTYKEFNLSRSRFNSLMEIVKQGGKEAYSRFCKQTFHACFACFEKDGEKIYFQTTDGNHRVIVAKNLGVSEIKAHRVTHYQFNAEKYEYYLRFKKLEIKILDNVKKAGFKVVEEFGEKSIQIETEDRILYFEHFNYYDGMFIWDYENIEMLLVEMEMIDSKYSYINQKITQYLKYLKLLPLFVKNIWLKWMTYKDYETMMENDLALLLALSKEIEKEHVTETV